MGKLPAIDHTIEPSCIVGRIVPYFPVGKFDLRFVNALFSDSTSDAPSVGGVEWKVGKHIYKNDHSFPLSHSSVTRKAAIQNWRKVMSSITEIDQMVVGYLAKALEVSLHRFGYGFAVNFSPACTAC